MDALVTWPGGQLAVEVDGPTHFIPDPAGGGGTVKSTATRLRDLQLAAWGVPVLSVEVAGKPVRHFSSAAFQAELTTRLRGAGVPLDRRSWGWPQAPHTWEAVLGCER